MILKLQDAGGNWVMFDEVDCLRYEDVTHQEDIAVREGVIDYTHQFPKDLSVGDENPKKNVKEYVYQLWFMNRNQTEFTQVLCHPPVYIMNNDGKTIERL